MSKEELVKVLGEELANQVLEKIGDNNDIEIGVKGSIIPKHRFDEVLQKNKDLEKEIATRDSQIKTLGESAKDNETLKTQIEQMKTDNQASMDKMKADFDAREKNMLIDHYLTGKGAKNVKAVRAAMFSDETLNKVSVKDGALVGMDDIFKAGYEGNEYLFNQSNGVTKGGVGSQGGGSKTESEQFADFTTIR